MNLDCALADSEFVCNHFVRFSGDDEVENLMLPFGELIDAVLDFGVLVPSRSVRCS